MATDPAALVWDAATSLLYVASERGTISIFSVTGGPLRKAAESVLADDAHSIAVLRVMLSTLSSNHPHSARSTARRDALSLAHLLASLETRFQEEKPSE